MLMVEIGQEKSENWSSEKRIQMRPHLVFGQRGMAGWWSFRCRQQGVPVDWLSRACVRKLNFTIVIIKLIMIMCKKTTFPSSTFTVGLHRKTSSWSSYHHPVILSSDGRLFCFLFCPCPLNVGLVIWSSGGNYLTFEIELGLSRLWPSMSSCRSWGVFWLISR